MEQFLGLVGWISFLLLGFQFGSWFETEQNLLLHRPWKNTIALANILQHPMSRTSDPALIDPMMGTERFCKSQRFHLCTARRWKDQFHSQTFLVMKIFYLKLIQKLHNWSIFTICASIHFCLNDVNEFWLSRAAREFTKDLHKVCEAWWTPA